MDNQEVNNLVEEVMLYVLLMWGITFGTFLMTIFYFMVYYTSFYLVLAYSLTCIFLWVGVMLIFNKCLKEFDAKSVTKQQELTHKN